MRFVGSSKVSKLVPKPDIVYPLIRLPQECFKSIGKTANIYETSRDEKQVFLVILDDDLDKKDKVIKPVIKPDLNTGLDQRLSAIESQIADLKSLILLERSQNRADKENKRPRARFEPASWPPQGHRITRLPYLGTK